MKSKNRLLTALLAVCLLPSLSYAAHHEEGEDAKKDKTLERVFKMADTDESGTISKAEAEAARTKMLAKRFDTLDADKDGEISKAEFETIVQKKRKNKKKEKSDDTDDE